MTSRLQTFEVNETGRDFVVGDIHGCFHRLDALLGHIGFDRYFDRLFSVGDLMDRGPNSDRVIEYINAPWFHAIRGNHEQMLLDAAAAPYFSLSGKRRLWEANGGGWFYQLSRAARRDIVERVANLPHATEVALANGAVAAIVHADVIDDSWSRTREFLREAPNVNDPRLAELIWSRARAEGLKNRRAGSHDTRVAVTDVDVITFGHSIMPMPMACANTRWIDTGAFQGNRLSIAELGLDGHVWSLADDFEDCRGGWQWV